MPELPQPALVDAAGDGPIVRSRRQFLSGPPRREADGYWIRVHRRAMACRFEITLDDRDAAFVPAARAALDEIDRLEDLLSVFRPASAVSDLNRRAADAPVAAAEELFALLQLSAGLHEQTGGAFDITSTPLSKCWGFLDRDGRLPPPEAIDAARALVGARGITLDAATRTVRFDRCGMQVSFGAIGKGYALDRTATGMRAEGVRHALLSAGNSSLRALGGRGPGWQVEIVSPRLTAPIARVWLRNAALGTSGAGEQFVEIDGVRYGHVIDPRTGWPASGVLSASVIASSAAVADALSTAFLIGGRELAEQYCASHPNVLALITPDDGSKTILIGEHTPARVVVLDCRWL